MWNLTLEYSKTAAAAKASSVSRKPDSFKCAPLRGDFTVRWTGDLLDKQGLAQVLLVTSFKSLLDVLMVPRGNFH